MSEHTKGPWAWQLFGKEHYLTGQWGMRPIVLGTLDGKITSLMGGLLEPLDPNHPDARLIAAAPDLLAALENILNPFSIDDDGAQAREAITKAKGT